MNLTEALDVALPELPARRALKAFPRIHPKLVWREHIEEGAPVIISHVPGTSELFRFSREQWGLVQLFDGRSYAEVAQAYQEQTGIALLEADLREFSETLQQNGFWYQTGQEKYEAETRAEHKRSKPRKTSRFADLSRIHFSAWDPDAFLTRVYPYFKFLYSGWFTVLTLVLFGFMIYVFVDHWGEVGRDTVRYYTFTEKGFLDLAEFWLLFFALGFFHESAHGLTCKHYGGGVHHMGFQLLYLTPTFFVEVTEGWVYANRWQRLPIIIAGIWIELIFCAVATIVWWGTAAGVYAHELAYKVMLITGVAVVIVNLNPLIKLDGYYFFSELIGVPDIKEKSTSFVTGWIKRNMFALPADHDYVTPRRAWLYVVYALLSGAYSYLLLLAVARFAYNVMRNYSPEWAFIPALYLLYLMFRARLRNLVTFMKTVYLDKKERTGAWLTAPRLALLGVVAAVVLFTPVWRQTVEGRFALEPMQRAVVRAEVPGQVAEILVDEGTQVNAGAPLLRLRNLTLESEAARALADSQVAAASATQAQLRYKDFGPAQREQERTTRQSQVLAEELAKLRVASPIGGTVVTPRVRDALGSYMRTGAPILEVADLSQMRARIYVPEVDLRDVRSGAGARVKLDAGFGSIPGYVASLAPASTEIEPGLVHVQEYKGIRAPTYYVAIVAVPNRQGLLREGMSGTAKIDSVRRSAAGYAWRMARDFLGRKIW
jgi:putative peptide zinc metalloprotease protein